MSNEFWIALGLNLANAMMPVLVASLPVLIGALVALAVQYVRLIEAKIKAENPTEYEKIEWIVRNAVVIAEQLGLSGQIQDKKQWAIQYAQKKLDEIGIAVDLKQLELEIEKAVFLELNS